MEAVNPPGPDESRGVDDSAAAGVLLEIVRELVAELHGSSSSLPSVRLTSRLEADLGIDSLALVELRSRVEAAFDVELPDEVFATATTPKGWLQAVLVARGHPPAAEPSGRRWQSRSDATPEAGGSGELVAGEPVTAETLVDVLAWHEQHHGDRLHTRVLHLPDAVEGSAELTYGALIRGAREVASGLRQQSVGPGDTVAIMLPTGPEYFEAFLGVSLCGAIPVPLYPPSRPLLIEDHLRRQARILANASVSVLLSDDAVAPAARLLKADVPQLRASVTVAELRHEASGHLDLPAVHAASPALIQYSSGSTGYPKGVVLTHTQLLANIRAMGTAAAIVPQDVFVSWLPLYHDMGLIGGWLTSLYFGFLFVVMSPLAFLSRPSRWLRAVSDWGGTLSASPNFGYEFTTRHIGEDELDGLDLSSWRIACNGAEPVSAETIERFGERFGPFGFRRETMLPVYGLAETGVGLTFPPLGRGPRVDVVSRQELATSARAVPVEDGSATRAVVSCGRPLPGYAVRVVGTAGHELPERSEGRIEFTGPSATSGYFGDAAATKALFHGSWLDTGDIGYMASGELYLTGRAKDLVIRAGRNLHPEELEGALGDLDGVRRGGVAVFGVPDEVEGTERLVAVLETNISRDDETARADLRARVTATTVDVVGTPPDDVVLAPPGSVLKTPSGKVRRAETRDRYEHHGIGRRPPSSRRQILHFAWSSSAPRLHRLAAASGSLFYAVYAWMVVTLVGVPVWLGVCLLPSVQLRWRLVRTAGRVLNTFLGVKVHVRGVPPGPGSRYVVVANHMSFVDGLVLIECLPEPITFVAGDVLERQRIAGPFLRRIGSQFVARDAVTEELSAAQKLVEVVRSGHRLAAFPEASVDRAVGVRPFHLGAFAAATETGTPVLPIGIRGTRDIVRPGGKFPRHGSIDVAIGDLVAPPKQGWDSTLQLAHEVRRLIGELSGEPLVG